MICLVDTNVAARSILVDDPNHASMVEAVDHLREQGGVLHVTAQVLIEFHALATRPVQANGLGMTAAAASHEARKIEAIFTTHFRRFSEITVIEPKDVPGIVAPYGQ